MLSLKIKTKLNEIIDDLEKFCLRVDEGLIQLGELEDKFYDAKDEVHQLFDKDTDEWRIFDNWKQKYNWRKMAKPGYAQTKNNDKILSLIEIIKKILGRETPHVEKKEKSFSSSQPYEAKRYILQLFQSAQNKIIIVDSYLDEKIFDYIDAIDSNIELWLLTDKEKKIFRSLFTSLAQNRKKIFAKYNNESHDRYIIIDDTSFYHMGASINTIGKKDFMINKIETEKEQKDRLVKFSKWWDEGKDIN